jgi:hypothetical protein
VGGGGPARALGRDSCHIIAHRHLQPHISFIPIPHGTRTGTNVNGAGYRTIATQERELEEYDASQAAEMPAAALLEETPLPRFATIAPDWAAAGTSSPQPATAKPLQ